MGFLGLIVKFFGEVIAGIFGIIGNFLGGILYVVGWAALHLLVRVLSLEIFNMTASQIFFRVLSLELSVLPVLGAVLLARWLLKKTPRRAVCLLWLVLWLRLLLPFTIEVPWGLTARPDALEEPAAASVEVSLPGALDAAQRSVGDALGGGSGTVWVQTEQPEAADGSESGGVSLTHGEVWLLVSAWIWEAGVAGMLLYSAVSLVRLRLRLRGAARLEGNVYLSDRAGSPFVLGLLRPKIYLPSDLPEEDRDLILGHERAHIRGWHHVWKPLAFLALAVHWFNPLAWLAFYLFVCDLEAACDEAATAALDREGRADYAAALLRLSAPLPRRAALRAPLAFGEGDPKGRITRVLTFRRPAAWVAAGAVVLAALLGGLLLTSRNAAEYPLGAEYWMVEWSNTYQLSPQISLDSLDSPDVIVSGDYHLWTRPYSVNRRLTDQGQLERCDMTRRELLSYCHGGDFDKYWGVKPGQIAQAWWVREWNDEARFYLLFRTTDGDTWLAYGWEDLDERSLFHGGDLSDDTTVYWIVKLGRADEASPGRYFSADEALALGGGVDATVRGTLECGEQTAAYVDYWYSPEGGAGFAVYKGGDRGGFLAQDRSEFVERTGLYTYSMDQLKEAAPGSGVYTLPVSFALAYDGKTEKRTPVLCLNENIRDIQRTATRADGTVLSQERDSVMGRGMIFLPTLPYAAGQAVTVTYQFYNDQGDDVFFGGDEPERPAVQPLPEGQGYDTAEPTEAQVLALRERVEAGMTEEEIARLRDVIFTANNWLEHQYFYDRLFEHLSDPEDLYWNYFEQTGEIQTGWAVDGSIDKAAVCAREGLTEKEFYEKYGTAVKADNAYTLDDFIDVLEELKESVRSGLLDDDFDRLKDLCAQAKETRDYLCVNELFRMLHDMEYFLLRYGLTDVGPYVTDTSWLATYFGSLSVWQDAGPVS